METEKLKLPRMGFGTWQIPKKDCKAAVLKAIDAGYRFIDCAQVYFNEAQVGEALAECGVPRDDLIIATKVFVQNLSPKRVIKSTETSLKKLQLKTVDILYVHWPLPLFYQPSKTLKAFNQLVDEGKVRNIGVSNFNPKQVDKAIEVLKAFDKPVFANQIQHHPLNPQIKQREYLQKNGIYLVAYSPLARGKVFNVPVLQDIAKKHGVSAGQVSLAWVMEHGAIPIPKATSEAHIKDNFAAQDLVLDADDITKIDGLKK